MRSGCDSHRLCAGRLPGPEWNFGAGGIRLSQRMITDRGVRRKFLLSHGG